VWRLLVSGFVDDIRLSDSLAADMRRERLSILQAEEVSANEHLARVLGRVDLVPSVSISHQLELIEPGRALQTIQPSLTLPPALAPMHLQSFRQWYHNRIPLRLTQAPDPFAPLQEMLAQKTQFRGQ
jgi:hypothetical protein